MHNSSVVYVGVSAHPDWRYKEHHYDSASSVYHFGRYLLSLGKPLTIKVIDSAPNKLAGHKLERLYITHYSCKYHLLNDKECYEAIESIIPRLKQIINAPLLEYQKNLLENTRNQWENI